MTGNRQHCDSSLTLGSLEALELVSEKARDVTGSVPVRPTPSAWLNSAPDQGFLLSPEGGWLPCCGKLSRFASTFEL